MAPLPQGVGGWRAGKGTGPRNSLVGIMPKSQGEEVSGHERTAHWPRSRKDCSLARVGHGCCQPFPGHPVHIRHQGASLKVSHGLCVRTHQHASSHTVAQTHAAVQANTLTARLHTRIHIRICALTSGCMLCTYLRAARAAVMSGLSRAKLNSSGGTTSPGTACLFTDNTSWLPCDVQGAFGVCT